MRPSRNAASSAHCARQHLKWRHQAPVGPFYANILCFSEHLVIEVDGDTHAATGGYDEARTRFLNGEGYRVLRFANTDVIQNLGGVLTQISFFLREKEGANAQHGKNEGSSAHMEKGSAA